MSFAACYQHFQKTIRTTGSRPWDIVRIRDADMLTATRDCTCDGSVVISYNGPDRKIVVTKSPYQDGCPT